MNWIAVSSRAAAGLVAGVAGYASFNHIVKVAREAGENLSVAVVLPLSIDGLIVVGTMAMIDDKRNGRQPRLSARVALGFGVVATLAANVASARDTATARLVAAVPALAFLIAVEVLARTGRIRDVEDDDRAAPWSAPGGVESAVERSSSPVVEPWLYAAPIGPDPALPVPVSAVPVVDKLSTAKPVVRKRPPSSRDRVAAAHRRSPDATDAQLAARLELSEKTVQRYRPAKVSDTLSGEQQINGRVPELVGAGHDEKES